ncbi:MAG: SDR family oxidoreductase [Bacteroidetes bacterium]|nr:SDR family oxidoreductase [Bacteroidota bacterium]
MIFAGKNILIVGGSSGIGLTVVSGLSHEGARIYNLSRTSNEHWPPGIERLPFDVLADTAPAAGFLPEKLDGLVYLPGSINLKPFNRLTTNDFFTDYQINVLGAVNVLQHSLPALKNAGNASVVLMSSVAATVGMSFHASIAAAKGAINGLTLSLAAELAPHKIRVNAIAPSLTDTPLAAQLLSSAEKRESAAMRHPLGRFGAADDIAGSILFLLSDQSSWLTGQIIGVDGGMGSLRKN